MNNELASLMPPAVATATFDLPVTLPAAVVAVIEVSLTTLKLAASTSPNYCTHVIHNISFINDFEAAYTILDMLLYVLMYTCMIPYPH